MKGKRISKLTMCPICSCSVFRNIKNGNPDFDYARCQSCSSVFSRVYISPEALTDYYEKYDKYYSSWTPPNVVQTISAWITSFEEYRRLNRICDIGYGNGSLLKIANERGWSCSGNEFSDQSMEIGKENRWEIHRGPLGSGDLLGPFDVVTLIETVEHVLRPQSLINDAGARLRMGGVIFGTTPNCRSLNSLLLGGAWDIYEHPNHLVILSKKSLRMILELAGFSDIKIYSKGLNPYNFFKWLRNFGRQRSSASESGISRVELGIKIDTRLRSNFLGKSIKAIIQVLLRLTGLGDTLVFQASKIRIVESLAPKNTN